MATKRERPLNLCRVPEQQHLYGTYVSDITGSLYQTARTYSQTDTFTRTFVKMKLGVLEVDL